MPRPPKLDTTSPRWQRFHKSKGRTYPLRSPSALRDARRAAGIPSQALLADLVGCDKSRIGALEKVGGRVYVSLALLIAEHCATPVEALFDTSEDPT